MTRGDQTTPAASVRSNIPTHRWPTIRATRRIGCLVAAVLVAWAAAACASATSDSSSAASTHSAQTLGVLITQMAAQATPSSTASPTSNGTPKAVPSNTASFSRTASAIATVQFITPKPIVRRATYAGSTPTTDGTSLLTQTLTTRCNAAYFVGDVAPIFDNSEVKAGSTFVKTWVIRNVGTCTWYASYMIYWNSGRRMGEPLFINFPEITPPNKNVFLSVTLVAPDQPGKYYQRWYIRDPEFTQFGIGPNYSDPLMVRIVVVPE